MSCAACLRQCSALLTCVVSAILIHYELRAITHVLEEQDMQCEKRAHHVSEGIRGTAEPLAEHLEATPLVQTSSSLPPRRLTTRELSRRRRQRLWELLRHQGKPPAREDTACIPAPSPEGYHACSSFAPSS